MKTAYYVYILRCADDTFYTGITTEMERRLKEHNQGIGAKYTRNRRPVSLVHVEEVEDRSTATKRELEIKKWPRAKKASLFK
jgi:putative endonuclease